MSIGLLEPHTAAGIVSGHSDVAIGTCLAPGSRLVRGLKREVISRAYNRLLRTRPARTPARSPTATR